MRARPWLAFVAVLTLLLGGVPAGAQAAEDDQISGEIVLPDDVVVDDYAWFDLYLEEKVSWGWDWVEEFSFEADEMVDNRISFAFSDLDSTSEYRLLLEIGDRALAGGYYVADGAALTSSSSAATTLTAPATVEVTPQASVSISGVVELPLIDGSYYDADVELIARDADSGEWRGSSYLSETDTPGEYTFELAGLNEGGEYVIAVQTGLGHHLAGFYAAAGQTVSSVDDALVVEAPSSGVSFAVRAAEWIRGSVSLPEGLSGISSIRVEAHVEVPEDQEDWNAVSSARIEDDGTFAIGGLDPDLSYAIALTDWRELIVEGFYAGPGVPLSSEPQLVAAGATDVVLIASATTWLRGTVALPPGAFPDDFEVALWEHSDDWGWSYTSWSPLDESGNFVFGGLREGEDYLLELESWDPTHVGGFYAGTNAGLRPGIDDAVAVTAPQSGIVITPELGTQISGVVQLPAAFQWEVGGGGNRIEVAAREILPGGGWGSARWTTISRDDAGKFTIGGLRPGASYTLEFYDWEDLFEGGYYHAGRGLVEERDDATPVTAGTSNVNVIISSQHVTPALSVVSPPAISGRPFVGEKLSVSAGAWSMAGVEVAYQWLRDGALIPGASSATYTPVAADVGKRLSGLVTAVKAGYAPVQAVTAATAPVAFPTFSNTVRPGVTGIARVGEVLVASTGSWDQPGVSTTAQWLRDGVPIALATQNRYVVEPGDAGARISVRVTASKPGYADAVATSLPTAVVAKGPAPQAKHAPAVTGKARFGATLRATPGSWDAPAAQHVFQWLRAGKAIKGATSATYKVKRADVGKRISVRVTARVPGYAEGLATSSLTKKVAKAKPKVRAKAKAVKAGKRARVVIRIKAAGVPKPRGTVRVKYGKKTVRAKVAAKAKGKLAVRLPKLTKGRHTIRVTYVPKGKSAKVLRKATSKKVTLRVR